LRKLGKQVKIDGFRPGKVPFNVVAQRYGYSVQYEVVNDKVNAAFNKAAQEAQLRVAGAPSISEAQSESQDGVLKFDAVFEVFPEVVLPDLSALELEQVSTVVDEGAIERTIEILRKQKRSFAGKDAAEPAAKGDLITLDFEGKIDGETFAGGKAENFDFILGEGRMLAEFEEAVTGMKVGESKTFPLAFPADYHGKEVAGKQADFMIHLKKIQVEVLPEINEDFIKSLGIGDGTVEAMQAEIRRNLEREVANRLRNINKNAALQALADKTELDLPKASVQAEAERLSQSAREDLKQRGVKDADKAPMPQEIFMPQAERRVKLGLVVGDLVREHGLQAKIWQPVTNIRLKSLSGTAQTASGWRRLRL
jgi:trigger factor